MLEQYLRVVLAMPLARQGTDPTGEIASRWAGGRGISRE